ncbi:BI1-like protein, partial [Quillaja saponaria]
CTYALSILLQRPRLILKFSLSLYSPECEKNPKKMATQTLTRLSKMLRPTVTCHLAPSSFGSEAPLRTITSLTRIHSGHNPTESVPLPSAISPSFFFLNNFRPPFNLGAQFYSRKAGISGGGKSVDLHLVGKDKEDDVAEVNLDQQWGFIQKVYSVMASQFFVTATVSAAVMFCDPLKQLLLADTNMTILSLLPAQFLSLGGVFYYKDDYPKNIVSLGAFTLAMSLGVGTCCAVVDGKVVLEALSLTAAAVSSLTGCSLVLAHSLHL